MFASLIVKKPRLASSYDSIGAKIIRGCSSISNALKISHTLSFRGSSYAARLCSSYDAAESSADQFCFEILEKCTSEKYRQDRLEETIETLDDIGDDNDESDLLKVKSRKRSVGNEKIEIDVNAIPKELWPTESAPKKLRIEIDNDSSDGEEFHTARATKKEFDFNEAGSNALNHEEIVEHEEAEMKSGQTCSVNVVDSPEHEGVNDESMPCKTDPDESSHSSNFLFHEKEIIDINDLSNCNASERNHKVGEFDEKDKYRSKLVAFQLVQNSLDNAGVRGYTIMEDENW